MDDHAIAWKPTHKHAEGGAYMMIGPCHIHTGISEWTDGVIYRNLRGEVFVRPAGEFAARFTAIQDKNE